jgi:indolepyruvate ferredoxin oxidoreductase beta subunit
MMKTYRILIVGLGGQGVILCSNILAHAAVAAGYDVKKSEVHGMAQRGGSVTTHVIIGDEVHSPLVEQGHADIIIALENEEIERVRHYLRPGGIIVARPDGFVKKLKNPRSINVAMLGLLAKHVEIPEEKWLDAIRGALKEKLVSVNIEAFKAGLAAAK